MCPITNHLLFLLKLINRNGSGNLANFSYLRKPSWLPAHSVRVSGHSTFAYSICYWLIACIYIEWIIHGCRDTYLCGWKYRFLQLTLYMDLWKLRLVFQSVCFSNWNIRATSPLWESLVLDCCICLGANNLSIDLHTSWVVALLFQNRISIWWIFFFSIFFLSMNMRIFDPETAWSIWLSVNFYSLSLNSWSWLSCMVDISKFNKWSFADSPIWNWMC